MLIQISVAVIALTMVILIVFLALISYQTLKAIKAIKLIEKDMHEVFQEAKCVLTTVNEFIQEDLHPTSQEINHLISNVNSISEGVKNKFSVINFLFRPLKILSSKLDAKLFSNNSSSLHLEAVSQILQWIVSGVSLIKTTKEFVKHEK